MGPKGNIVFSSVAERVQIWAARLRPNAGVISGSPRQLTSTAGFEYYPSATRAGNLIAFISSRSGNRDIWIHDLRTGRESPLTESAANEWIPRVNAKGDVVAYALGGQGQDGIYFHPVAGTPQKAVDGSSCAPWAWSHSGRYFIYGAGTASTGGSLLGERYFKLLDLVTRRHSDLLREPEFQLFQAAFSPDDAWIAFNASGRIFVVSFNPRARIPSSQWVRISDGEWINDKPRWSPDGTLIYFVSDRDGSRCIWAQRVDANSKRPQGPTFAVYHAHHVRRTLATSLLEIDLSSDDLIFSMSEITGNLWLRQR